MRRALTARHGRCRRYPPILIFPEGTTTNGQCLIDFKRGAFVPGVPVKPVVLKYPSHHYNPADTGRHSGNKSLFWLMLQFANWIEITELDTCVGCVGDGVLAWCSRQESHA